MIKSKLSYFLPIVFILNILLWVLLTVVILSSAGPYNTTSFKFLNKSESLTLRSFFPEGFGFFSRDPQEEFPLIYKEVNDNLVLLTKPNSSLKNMLGLRRSQRSIFAELGIIVSEVADEDWSRCASSLVECWNSKTIKILKIENMNHGANLCGTYLISTKKPIPWAWRNTFKGEMPQRFVKLIIRCE